MVSVDATFREGVCCPLALPKLCFWFKKPFLMGLKLEFNPALGSAVHRFYPQIINGKLRPGDGEFPMVHEPRIPSVIPVKPV